MGFRRKYVYINGIKNVDLGVISKCPYIGYDRYDRTLRFYDENGQAFFIHMFGDNEEDLEIKGDG